MESHLFMVNIKNGEINFFLTIRTRVSLKNDEANCVVVLRDFFSELAFGKSISSNFSDKHLSLMLDGTYVGTAISFPWDYCSVHF